MKIKNIINEEEVVKSLSEFINIDISTNFSTKINLKYLQLLQEDIATVLFVLEVKNQEIEKYKEAYLETSNTAAMRHHYYLQKNMRMNKLEQALLEIVIKFSNRTNTKGNNYLLDAMELSALERAFNELGLNNPCTLSEIVKKYRDLHMQTF